MKIISVLVLLLILGHSKIQAQLFENGLSLYEQGDYERAIRIFKQSEEPEALLFAGKSFFALNNYITAVTYLNRISKSAPIDIFQEARFTISLAHFQSKNFSKSLEILKQLGNNLPSTTTSREALILYDQILGYLTLNQKREAFTLIENQEIRLDLIESLVFKVNHSSAKTFLDLYKKSTETYDQLRVSRIESLLIDSVSYSQRYNPNQVAQAPKGISYNIGVVLPEFDFETPEYEIPQHIYFGIQLAVEEFNTTNTDQKAFLTFRNTSGSADNAESIISDFAWKNDVDVIIGPLFSEVAKTYSNLAEQYEIPMLLPLANSDSLDLFNNFVFQLNPSFEMQGKLMAREAVNKLGYDTLGVIAEARSLGAPAARAFRHEAERLGGFVQYYFEENLEKFGYDIRDYTKFFTTDTLDSLDMVEAVFAPFTGSVAPTLIESMLTDLEAMRSTVAILGSEEWMNVDLEDRRLADTELYFTEAFNVDTSTTKSSEFASSFRLRFNTQPNQFAYIGYDAANVVLQTLKKVKNSEYFRDALKDLNGYEGLSNKVSFRGSHINHELKIKRMPRESDFSVENLEDIRKK